MSDGVEKLRNYLEQTRRQAELSIEALSQQVNALTNENEELKDHIEILSNERQQYKEQAERLKLENTKKWKFQERDDWKCLVESLQSDRTRLQDENGILQRNIELEKEKIIHLEDEINNLSNEILSLRNKLNNLQNSYRIPDLDVTSDINGISLNNVTDSPITPSKYNNVVPNHFTSNHSDSSEQSPDNTNIDALHATSVSMESPDMNIAKMHHLHQMTPRAASNVLHFELEKVQRKLKYERKVAKGELLAQTEEIKNLRRHLNIIITTRMQQPIPIEYLDHKASTSYSQFNNDHDNKFDSNSSGSSSSTSRITSLFSWEAIVSLIFPSAYHKTIDFQSTEIIHI